jgi:5-oxoprolinase (ATP-hydrolysing) subunit A
VDRIDLNSDVGESFGTWSLGDDQRLVPLVSSVNVACGFHAGDPLTIQRTVALAVAHGVAVGAHPGYPDLAGFGRRDLDMAADELEAALVYQIGAVAAFARAAGSDLRHVKPHGALYNRAARDAALAASIARAVRAVSVDLVLVGLVGSALLDAGREAGLRVAAEAFADRTYEPDGSLRSRRKADAVLATPEAAAEQALQIARHRRVETPGGSLPINADTLCIHGDTPNAPDVARAVREALESAGIAVGPVGA